MSIVYTGSIAAALWLFFAGYGAFLAVTWWFYLRRRMTAWSPSLAAVQV